LLLAKGIGFILYFRVIAFFCYKEKCQTHKRARFHDQPSADIQTNKQALFPSLAYRKKKNSHISAPGHKFKNLVGNIFAINVEESFNKISAL